MSLVRWAFIGLLVLPGAEMLVFVLVGAAIGWLKAVILLVTPSIIGVMLLKRSASREVARLARVLRTEGMFALRLDLPGCSGHPRDHIAYHSGLPHGHARRNPVGSGAAKVRVPRLRSDQKSQK